MSRGKEAAKEEDKNGLGEFEMGKLSVGEGEEDRKDPQPLVRKVAGVG